jgi:autotransporter-associated beta strand protein
LIKVGSGILDLSGGFSYSGDTIVKEGTLELDTPGSSAGALRLTNGVVLNLNYVGTSVVVGFYTNNVALAVGTYNAGNLPAFITGSGSVQVSSGISTGIWTGVGANNNWSTAGNWDNGAVPVFPHGLTFAGSTRLVNNNDLSSITVNGITFDAAAGAFVLNGSDITLAGNIVFSANPAAPATQTINLNMGLSGGDKIITVQTNGNFILGGNNTGAFRLTQNGNGTPSALGTVTMSGVNSFSGLIVNAGTNKITGNTTVNGNGNGRFALGNQNPPNNGTLDIENGAVLTVIGNFVDSLVIGRDGGSGTVIQNGGTFTFSPGNNNRILLGATGDTHTRSEYHMNGGLLDMSGNNLSIGWGSTLMTGVVSQVSGVITNLNEIRIPQTASANNGLGVYTLSGGSIYLLGGGIVTDGSRHQINLGQGMVGAEANWASSLSMNLTNLGGGSVTFDTGAGNTITLSGALTGNGGLTVVGSGTLDLSGANSYTGDTTVNAGTLQSDQIGSSLGAFRVTSGAVLNLTYSGTYPVAAFYTNGVALPNGIYNAGNLGAFITGGGSLQVAGVVFSSQPQNQLVYLNGGNSATLTSATVGGSPTYQWYLNGNIVSGATSSTLALSNLQITNGGNYYVVATSGFQSVTSSVASVTIFGENNSLFAYEGFNYTNSATVNVDGMNGGFGWNGAWVHQWGNLDQVTLSGSLVGGANVPAGYDALSITNALLSSGGNDGRFLDCSTTSALWTNGYINAKGNIGASGKTLYVGFLQNEVNASGGYWEFDFQRGNLNDPGRMGGIGNDVGDGNVHLRSEYPAGQGSTMYNLGAGTANIVNFYVVRIDYNATSGDTMRVYRNPTSTTEPAISTLTVSNLPDYYINGFAVASGDPGHAQAVDEIRVGATWADAIGLAVSNLLPPTKTVNGYMVRFACTPGYSYRIQRATVLTGPWTDIATVVGGANAFVQYEDTSAPVGGAFYRTVTP